MVDETTRWQPDPYGVHELRFFSVDGRPTLLVMDGEDVVRQASDDRSSTSSGATIEGQARTAITGFGRPAAGDCDRRGTGGDGIGNRADRCRRRSRFCPGRFTGGGSEGHEFADDRSAPAYEDGNTAPLSRPMRIAYVVVFAALALSALGLVYVHAVMSCPRIRRGHNGQRPPHRLLGQPPLPPPWRHPRR